MIELIPFLFLIMASSFIAGHVAAAIEPKFESKIFCALVGVLAGLITMLLGSVLIPVVYRSLDALLAMLGEL